MTPAGSKLALRPRRPLLIDANLLLMFLVGSVDASQVGTAKRTKEYSPADYRLLERLVSSAQQLVVTPNILTEVSNLARKIDEPMRGHIVDQLALFTVTHEERYVKSAEAVRHRHFQRLGLADAATLLSAEPTLAIITDDAALYDALARTGMPVENFTHLRVAEGTL